MKRPIGLAAMSKEDRKRIATMGGKSNKGRPPWNKGMGKGWLDKRGYRWLYVIENGRRVARREHRVLMERHLGRKLDPWELVHHRNGNPTDNRADNLEVRDWPDHTKYHHLGTRRDGAARRSAEAFAL